MTARLDQLIESVASRSSSELDAVWDIDRSERVREGALRRRDGRVRRDRLLRRGLLVASGAGLLVLALLRAASSAPAEPLATSSSSARELSPAVVVPAPAPTAEALASRAFALADAGYARD